MGDEIVDSGGTWIDLDAPNHLASREATETTEYEPYDGVSIYCTCDIKDSDNNIYILSSLSNNLWHPTCMGENYYIAVCGCYNTIGETRSDLPALDSSVHYLNPTSKSSVQESPEAVYRTKPYGKEVRVSKVMEPHERIEFLMHVRNISRYDLAKKSKINIDVIKGILKGQTVINDGIAAKLCRVLDVSEQYLLYGDQELHIPPDWIDLNVLPVQVKTMITDVIALFSGDSR